MESSTSAPGVAQGLLELERGDQELSNKKKFIKIGPLLRKLQAKMSFCTNASLHIARALHKHWWSALAMCKLVMQTGRANCSCKMLMQTARKLLMQLSMSTCGELVECSSYVQTSRANWSCKLLMQTAHAALHERLWRAARALVESCTSARGELHERSWRAAQTLVESCASTCGELHERSWRAARALVEFL